MAAKHAFRLGVIGGLGPLASGDFYGKVTRLTPAATDQGHIPLVLLSIPETPDRSAAIFGAGPSPLPALQSAVRTLDAMAVELVVMTCNTAHHWYDILAAQSRADILHIADCSIIGLKRAASGRRVMVFATRGTIRSGFYQTKLTSSGYLPLVPSTDLQDCIDAIIASTKQGDIGEAAKLCDMARMHLVQMEVDAVLLACTELPIAWEATPGAGRMVPLAIDVNHELARETVRRLGYPMVDAFTPPAISELAVMEPPLKASP